MRKNNRKNLLDLEANNFIGLKLAKILSEN